MTRVSGRVTICCAKGRVRRVDCDASASVLSTMTKHGPRTLALKLALIFWALSSLVVRVFLKQLALSYIPTMKCIACWVALYERTSGE